MAAETSILRNLGIVAHINAGKTTLTERILYLTGKQRWVGDVESGTATMDWMVEEQRRGISITAAVTCVDWKDVRVQLIDTPGHVDFTAEVERCMRVLDGTVVLLDGVRGVESQTETVWRSAEAHSLPSLLFVNKLDRESSDYAASVESFREVFGCRAIELVRPVMRDGQLVALVDVLTGRAAWGSSDALPGEEQLAAWRQEVLEVCADTEDAIMADFVEGVPIETERLRAALRRATLARQVVPVFGGSALHDIGVDLLLDGVRDYLPSPRDVEEVFDGFAALLFKVHLDGDECLGFLRVFGGELRPGDEVEIASTGAPLRVGELWRMHSMDRDEVECAVAGEFVAIRLPMPLHTGETIRAPGSDAVLEEMRFSEPVLTMTLEPRTSEGRAELETRARAMAFEDPTLVVRRDPDSERLLVSGMGELHLEVFGSRLNRRLDEPARFGRPSVARYETVAGEAEDESSLARRVGDAEASAVVRVRVAPRPDGIEVASSLDSNPVTLAVCEELQAAARVGFVAFPARNLRIDVLRADAHGDVDLARDLAIEAAVVASRRALTAAGRVELEPDVDFVVEGPSDSFGSVLADLRSRGAEIGVVVPSYGRTRVEGRVRLAAMLDYASSLRSMTQGKGSVRFELGRFVPSDG